MVRHLLDGATIATCLNSLAPHKWLFKMWKVFPCTLYSKVIMFTQIIFIIQKIKEIMKPVFILDFSSAVYIVLDKSYFTLKKDSY